MMTGGRILHHLKQRLPSSRNTIVLGGFRPPARAAGCCRTVRKWIRIHGQDVPVRAAVETCPASAATPTAATCCAGSDRCRAPKGVFLIHGEVAELPKRWRQTLRTEQRLDRSHIPALGEHHELS